jgi:hypothetical protein
LTNEISDSLLEQNSHDIIETGYVLDERINNKKPKKYKDTYLIIIILIAFI